MNLFKPTFLKDTWKRSKKLWEEIALEIFPDSSSQKNEYSENGIGLRRTAHGVKLTYTGILANHGAQEITLVIGEGTNRYWNNVKEIVMEKTDNHVFNVILPEMHGDFQFALKDNANHWDNNSGKNYSIYQS